MFHWGENLLISDLPDCFSSGCLHKKEYVVCQHTPKKEGNRALEGGFYDFNGHFPSSLTLS